MTKDRNILLVLALILAFFAAWRIFSYRASHGEKNPEVVEQLQQAVATKAPELFTEKPVYQPNKTEDSSATLASDSSIALPSGEGKISYTTQTGTNTSLPSMAVTTKSQKYPSSYTPNRTVGKSDTASTLRTNGANTPQNASFASSTRNTDVPTPSEQMAQERAANLSPYLVPNKEVQKRLDADFKNLNNAVSRAIQAAMTPKSKKNANIEKYLNKDGATTTVQTNADPFQAMLAQISNQKKDIVQNVTEAFGAQAGQRAGKLMDNFQKDLTTEVSKTDQQPQVTAQNIQKIAQKYQQKFDRMNQQNQYEQYVKEVTAQYNAQVKSLTELYPGQDQLNAEFARISNEALQKELSLSSQNLTSEEYAKARYDIQYNMRQEMEEAVKQSGTSLTGLHKYDNDRAQDILEDLEKKEEEGAIVSVPRKASADDTNALSETLLKESNDMLTQIEQAYGVQARADFKPILDNYYQEMMKTMQEPMTLSQRQKQQTRLRTESNRKMLEMQRDIISRMENVPPEQKEATLQAIEKEINALPKM